MNTYFSSGQKDNVYVLPAILFALSPRMCLNYKEGVLNPIFINETSQCSSNK